MLIQLNYSLFNINYLPQKLEQNSLHSLELQYYIDDLYPIYSNYMHNALVIMSTLYLILLIRWSLTPHTLLCWACWSRRPSHSQELHAPVNLLVLDSEVLHIGCHQIKQKAYSLYINDIFWGTKHANLFLVNQMTQDWANSRKVSNTQGTHELPG